MDLCACVSEYHRHTVNIKLIFAENSSSFKIIKIFELGNAIDSGMGLSITIDKLRVFINKTLSILSAYQ
jgi:hypothetical protein